MSKYKVLPINYLNQIWKLRMQDPDIRPKLALVLFKAANDTEIDLPALALLIEFALLRTVRLYPQLLK